MTAKTQPRELLSLEQWSALGEDDSMRYELQEGVLIVSPRARIEHQNAVLTLGAQLVPQLPKHWHAAAEPELLLEARTPATVRVPDLAVHSRTGGPRLTADDVALVVEILSPGTRGVDLVMKRHEYAVAGIPNYWIVDLDAASIEVLTLADGAYVGEWRSGAAEMTEPLRLTLTI